jgi:hypothetical protein
VLSFAQAREFVKKKNYSAECNATIEALEKEVTRHVKLEQARVDKMDKGDKCIKKGDDDVADAETEKAAAALELKNAKQSLANAKTQKITWTYTYDAVVAEHSCGYKKSSGFLEIKAKVEKLTKEVAEAKGKLETATTDLENEKKKAAKKKLKCQCDTYTKMQAEIQASKKMIQSENEKGWKKAKHLACVLAGTAQDKCDTSGMPTVTTPTLAAGVTKSACATASPTMSPTKKQAMSGSAVWKGYEYITMDGATCPAASNYGKCSKTCQSSYLSLPSGWSLAPYSNDVVQNVVAKNAFGTHVVVFSNGWSYGTKAYSTGKRHSTSSLHTSGSKYKASGCSLKVLMRRSIAGL